MCLHSCDYLRNRNEYSNLSIEYSGKLIYRERERDYTNISIHKNHSYSHTLQFASMVVGKREKLFILCREQQPHVKLAVVVVAFFCRQKK